MYLKRIAALVAAATLAASPFAVAQEVDFADKRIEVVISSSEGGGADTYARFIAAEISKELPGQPTILARNMRGGGGILASNWFEKNAKPDGLIIFSSTSSSKMRPIFGNKSDFEFDPDQWIPIVTSPNGYVAIGSKVADTMTIESILAQDKPMAMGMASVLGAATMFLLSWDMLGVTPRPAFNVPGSDSQLSFERGEFQLEANSVGSYHRLTAPEVESGHLAALFTFGTRMPDGSIVRDSSLPDVPTFIEVYEKVHGKPPSGEKWVAWEAMFDLIGTNSKSYVLPKGTPDNIVKVYRDAAKRALTNPEVVASQSYQNILGSSPQFFGDDAVAAAKKAEAQLTPEVVQWLKDWHMESFGVPLK